VEAPNRTSNVKIKVVAQSAQTSAKVRNDLMPIVVRITLEIDKLGR
jgi:hypothetical protein